MRKGRKLTKRGRDWPIFCLKKSDVEAVAELAEQLLLKPEA